MAAPEATKKVIRGSLKDLGLPQISKAQKTVSGLIVRSESPWETYQQESQWELAGLVMIAHRRSRPFKRVAIRELTKNSTHDLVDRLRLMSHANILYPREIYLNGNSIYGLFEIFPFVLEQVVKCPDLYPNEAQIGSIMGQVYNKELPHHSIFEKMQKCRNRRN